MLSEIVMIILPTSVKVLEISQSAQPTTAAEMLVMVLYSAAIPALVEEFVFRGVMLNSLRRYGDTFAVLFSALMFALVHGNVLQIAVGLPAGICLGYMTVYSGNIWIAVALHFVNNTIACLSVEICEGLGFLVNKIFGEINADLKSVIASGMLYVIYLILGFIGLQILKFNPENEDLVDSKGTVTCLTSGEKFRGLYFAPTVIISVIIYVGQCILFLIPAFVEFLAQ